MVKSSSVKEQTAVMQVLYDILVCILDENTSPVLYLAQEATFVIDGHDHWQIVLPGNFHIVHAKCRRNVHQPGAIVSGDVIGIHDIISWFVRGEESIQRHITFAFERFALHRF